MTSKTLTDKEIVKLCEDAVENSSGNSHELERAIGSLFVGRKLGWKVLYLIHDQRWAANTEEILLDETERSRKSIAYNAVRKMSNFWKAVKGEIPGVKTPEIT